MIYSKDYSLPTRFKLFNFQIRILALSFMLAIFSYSQSPPITKSFLLGQEKDKFYHQYFKKVNARMCSKSIFLIKEVADAFELLYKAAEQEGIHLTLISGFRSFEDQKRIWIFKYQSKYRYLYDSEEQRIKKIMEFSSMPGTSRHHWGTDIDILSLKNAYFDRGHGRKAFLWLSKNAPRYGFRQVYTPNRAYGYNEERWHFSYFPLSREYLMAYKKKISPKDIYGFPGYKLIKKLNIIDKYVFGINPKLLK